MRDDTKTLRQRLDTSANRIALSFALRGAFTLAVPLLLLPLLGAAAAGHILVIGALQTSIVDVGGPYGGRLRGMLANTIGAPVILFLGSGCSSHWWLAGPAMALVAIIAGLMRALGPGATSIGITYGVALLIGIELRLAAPAALQAALAYGLGGLWTIAVALAVWRLRPYKRIEQELAGVWEELAKLVGLLQQPGPGDIPQRRRERMLHERQRALRDAVERSRSSLGDTRSEISGPGTTIASLLVLLRGASRIGTAATALAELRAAGPEARAASAAIAALEQACRAVATMLARGRGEVPLAAYRQHTAALLAPSGGTASPQRAGRAAFALALRHLEAADETLKSLFGSRHRLPGLLPPLEPMPPWQARLATLRAHFSLQSLILRHGLRVALSAGLATAAMVWLAIPHGIWLPMTALVVPQPEFGGTLRRAGERMVGTVAGAAVAAMLLVLLHGSIALNLAIILLSFGVFALLRRRYGMAMVFLTPLIILLLGLAEPNPWIDIRDRVVDTVAGGSLALLTAYALWPQWEHERLSRRLAEAVRANALYLRTVFGRLSGNHEDVDPVPARRAAEIATGNVEAAFQRMLGEPKAGRGQIGRNFVQVTHLRRLTGHIGALAAQLEHDGPRCSLADALAEALEQILMDAATHLTDGKPCRPLNPPERQLVQVRLELAGQAAPEEIGSLIGRIASDVGALHHAATGQ